MDNLSCENCQGTGWLIDNIEGRSVAKRCKCFLDRQADILFEQANIPRRYTQCTFDNFEIHNDSHRHALKISKQFVKNYPVQDVGLLFIGPCGVGKTHLAIATILELIKEKKARCYFIDFRDLIRKIQSTYSPDSPLTDSDIFSQIFEKEVLVLDELGAKRTTAWVEETIFYIINNRYNNKKLTIFTSNYLDQEEEEEDNRESFFKRRGDSLVDRIGVRLRSRLYEMCKIVEMEGDDYRKKIKQAGYHF
ncbi:MAG: ATP-binding protein [Candidatus Aminicenantaceae bacterium]|jgi:DNA replication protein DnaC|nr:ATP-binding protein [Candidatus Heimdallarchaeota archaeon]